MRNLHALQGLGVALAIGFLLASPATAGVNPGVSIMGDVLVPKGEVRHDDVVCIGGSATIEGKVEGDVVVIGGRLNFSGEANDVVAIATRAEVGSGAIVHGDLVHVMGSYKRDGEVTVEGETVDVGSRLPLRAQRIFSHGLLGLFVMLRVVGLIVSGLFLLLISALAPERVERMSKAVEPRWPASLGFGLLAFIGVVVVCIGLAITLIGIPLAVLVGLLAKVLGLMGVAAILALFGKRIGHGIGLLEDSPAVVPSVMVGFVVIALIRFIPLIGELAWGILSIIGLGLALITKLGAPAVGATAP